jgi:hypothetical protein
MKEAKFNNFFAMFLLLRYYMALLVIDFQRALVYESGIIRNYSQNLVMNPRKRLHTKTNRLTDRQS